jgi:anti-sigma B factor antagonist
MQEQRRYIRVIMARGDIDLESAPSLCVDLLDALDTHREVVLDLSGVTFMDCAGLRALVHARNHADRRGARLILRRPGAPVLRLLRLTGLARRMTVES